MKPWFKKSVAIVGPGLIGGSIGMALRERQMAGEVIGIGRRQVSMDRALACGAVDHATLDLRKGVADADVVILAVPLETSLALGEQCAVFMKTGAILTDVGSVRGPITRKLHPIAQSRGVRFVGAHPMAGSEQSGVTAARSDLFHGAACVLSPVSGTDTAALDEIEQMWIALGTWTVRMSPDEHDRAVARISHLPHLAAACLTLSARESDLALAGGGFRDTTRIAMGDPRLWVDICRHNRRSLAKAARKLAAKLAAAADALEADDAETILRLLERAQSVRRRAVETWEKRQSERTNPPG